MRGGAYVYDMEGLCSYAWLHGWKRECWVRVWISTCIKGVWAGQAAYIRIPMKRCTHPEYVLWTVDE